MKYIIIILRCIKYNSCHFNKNDLICVQMYNFYQNLSESYFNRNLNLQINAFLTK